MFLLPADGEVLIRHEAVGLDDLLHEKNAIARPLMLHIAGALQISVWIAHARCSAKNCSVRRSASCAASSLRLLPISAAKP